MGSLFCTLDEAATRLGRSKRQLHNYANQGFLTKKLIDGKVVLQREEVEQLAIELGTDAPALNRKTFLRLLNRVEKLEMQQAVINHFIGQEKEYLRPDLISGVGMYEMAKEYLTKTSFQIPELELWLEQLEKIDEIALSMFAEANPTGKPWHLFFKLCLHLMRWISTQLDYSTTLKLQELYKQFDLCRLELRKAILAWAQVNEDTPLKAILKDIQILQTPKEALFSTILAKAPNKT